MQQLLENAAFITNCNGTGFYSYCKNFISLTLFSVGLTNSYSKITNKYQLKQKI